MRVNKLKVTFLLFVFCCVQLVASAQQLEIKGKVTDVTTNEPLPGVNIMVVGTTKGTVTDNNGNYTVSVADENAELEFSFIGYLKEKVNVNGQQVINIALVEDIQSLEEVVVVGYGKMKKSDLTGAVSSVSSDDMKGMPVSNIEETLQGRAAGVQVTQNTGAPGSGVSIQVRGIGSIARSSEPLYVIDGIPLDNTQVSNPQTGENGDKINPMANINPADIESIEILKDPASAAIYGARGANGVVLITTKRGEAGKTSFSFNTRYSVSEITKRYDLLDAKQYQTFVNEGLQAMRTPRGNWKYITDEEAEMYDTDWQDEIFRAAPTYEANLSARGGDEKVSYMVSGNYYDQQGTVIGTGFTRMSMRSNLDFKLTDNIRAGANLFYSKSNGLRQKNSTNKANINNNKDGGPIIMSALTSSPIYPVYDSTGGYGMDLRNRYIPNPVMLAKEQSLEYFTNRTLGNMYFDWEIIDNLTFHTNFGGDFRNTKENFFWGPYFFPDDGTQMPGSGRTSDNNYNGESWTLTNTLNYSLDIKNHGFTFLLGHEASKISNERTYAEVGGMTTDKVTSFDASPALLTSKNYYSGSTIESYFGRLNYNYGNKYLLQLNMRADGSSRFGPDNRWGYFPAGSAGWDLAQEDFMSNLTFISQLKVRTSMGITGNQEVGDYSWRGSVQVGTIDDVVMNYLSKTGGRYTSISDYGYSWEEHTEYNYGVDVSIFENRLTFSAEYYKRISDDLLLQVQLPITTGIESAWNNAGKITNSGVEFSMQSYNLTGEFRWTTTFNISTNNLKVNKLITDSLKGTNTILIEGKSLHFYTYKRHEYVDSLTGYVQLQDLNGDGEVTYGGGDADKTITGSPLPDFYGGISNKFEYKGFDLNIFMQFVYGNEVYNSTRQTLEGLNRPSGLLVGRNTTVEAFENRWLDSDVTDDDGNVIWERNVHTEYPTTNFNEESIDQIEGHDGWIEDGSYLRIKTVTLGYNLPSKLTSKIGVANARIYFTSNNLYTFTKYSGFDPEVNTVTGEGISANLSQGIDAGAYPKSRTMTVGFDIMF